jgi:MFS family permease
MGISVLGLLLTDFIIIFVTSFSKHIPGGYWFLVVGAIGEGLLSGRCPPQVSYLTFASWQNLGMSAAQSGYMADTTNESNRYGVLSISVRYDG